MDMTEQEAKTKWCPHMRVMSVAKVVPAVQQPDYFQALSGTANRHAVDSLGHAIQCLCIASGCMMWRWAESGVGADGKERGHCGLAGKPLV